MAGRVFRIDNSNTLGTQENNNEALGNRENDIVKVEQNTSMDACAESSTGQNKVGLLVI